MLKQLLQLSQNNNQQQPLDLSRAAPISSAAEYRAPPPSHISFVWMNFTSHRVAFMNIRCSQCTDESIARSACGARAARSSDRSAFSLRCSSRRARAVRRRERAVSYTPSWWLLIHVARFTATRIRSSLLGFHYWWRSITLIGCSLLLFFFGCSSFGIPFFAWSLLFCAGHILCSNFLFAPGLIEHILTLLFFYVHLYALVQTILHEHSSIDIFAGQVTALIFFITTAKRLKGIKIYCVRTFNVLCAFDRFVCSYVRVFLFVRVAYALMCKHTSVYAETQALPHFIRTSLL